MVSTEERNTALRFIVCLGVVSLFADMTYEGAYSAIGPLFKEMGASAAALGLVSGLGEMIAASLRFFSGRLVDRTRADWTVAGSFLRGRLISDFRRLPRKRCASGITRRSSRTSSG